MHDLPAGVHAGIGTPGSAVVRVSLATALIAAFSVDWMLRA
jgi:hypothetical protein